MEGDLEGFGLTIAAGGDLKRAWPMWWRTLSATVTLWRGHKSDSKPERAALGNKEKERERDWILPVEKREGEMEENVIVTYILGILPAPIRHIAS